MGFGCRPPRPEPDTAEWDRDFMAETGCEIRSTDDGELVAVRVPPPPPPPHPMYDLTLK